MGIMVAVSISNADYSSLNGIPPIPEGTILQENGDPILQENGDEILQE